jgi:hypothetical protein
MILVASPIAAGLAWPRERKRYGIADDCSQVFCLYANEEANMGALILRRNRHLCGWHMRRDLGRCARTLRTDHRGHPENQEKPGLTAARVRGQTELSLIATANARALHRSMKSVIAFSSAGDAASCNISASIAALALATVIHSVSGTSSAVHFSRK